MNTKKRSTRESESRALDKERLDPIDERQRYAVPESCRYLRCSRASLYNLIKAGELRVIKEGSRTYVPGSEIVRRSSVAVAA